MQTKVMTIVGTRPEIIKLSRVICELDKFTNHTLVHTGQNYDYELNEIFFKDLEIRKPDYFLNAVGKSTAETISKVINESDKIIEKVKPDAVLLYGEQLLFISYFSEGKQVQSFIRKQVINSLIKKSEEINRKIVDHLSDINMPLTEHAKQYFLVSAHREENVDYNEDLRSLLLSLNTFQKNMDYQ